MTVTYWPTLNPRVTEEAGTRGGTHSGIDLAANRGDPVLAQFAGQVVYAGGDGASGRIWIGYWLYPNGEGRTVDLRRDDGSSYNGMIQRVGHLEGYAVSSGQWVAPGQIIGYAGDSGYSTGVHVHLENRWDRQWTGGNWFNPRVLNPQVFTGQEPPAPVPPAAKKKRKLKMDNVCVCKQVGNLLHVRIFCLQTGEEHNFTYVASQAAYVDNVAKTYGCGPKSIITPDHYDQIGKELAATRARILSRK